MKTRHKEAMAKKANSPEDLLKLYDREYIKEWKKHVRLRPRRPEAKETLYFDKVSVKDN